MNISTLKKDSPYLMICLQLVGLFIINTTACFGHYVGLDSQLISNLFKTVIAFTFVVVLLNYHNAIPKYVYVFSFFAIIVILLNFALFPENYQFPSTVSTFAFLCFPLFVVGSIIDDFAKLKAFVRPVCYFISIFIVGLLLLTLSGRIVLLNEWGNEGYSMGFGNSCALPAMFMIWFFLEEKRILYLLSSVLIVLGIVSFGSRGPLVSLVVFSVVYYTILNFKKNPMMVFGGFFICLILFFNLNSILSGIGQMLNSCGIHSRTINLIFSGEQEIHLSRRDELANQLIPILNQSPLEIRGINAEWNILGIYAHNIFLEIFFQFGLILGSLILLYILIRLVKTLRMDITKEMSVFALIFMCNSFSQSLVSGSIWTLPYFWLWISLVYSYNRHKQYLTI